MCNTIRMRKKGVFDHLLLASVRLSHEYVFCTILIIGFYVKSIQTNVFKTEEGTFRLGIQKSILDCYTCTHRENYEGSSSADYESTASDDGHDIPSFLS